VRLPNVSIATLMGAVVILAVDIALLRDGFRDDHAIFYILGLAPMANLVMAVTIAEAARVGRRGEGQPFWTGFACFGGMAMLAASSYVVLTRSDPGWQVLRMLWVLLGETNYEMVIGPVPVLQIAISSLYMTLPQLTLALFGGWLFRKFRLVIVQHAGDAPCPEA